MMVVEKNKVVSVSYILRENGESGTLLESVSKDQPLEFLVGAGNMLPAFESALMGMKTGDSSSFVLPAGDAYGEHDQGAIVDLPLNVFEVDGRIEPGLLEPGRSIPMMDNEGHRMYGIITAVSGTAVTMDFNHPMAGKNLHFSVEVVGLREATPEEKIHGHVHGPEGSHGCSCGGH